MTSKDTNDSSDYHGSLRNHLERENLRKDFEIMWQASLGRRKEILLVMVAIGLALFFGGLNSGFQTAEYSLMYGGLLLAAWGCIGLTPGIVIQDCIASQPFLAVGFMRQKPEVGVKTFSRELLIYLHDHEHKDVGRLKEALLLDKTFAFMCRHILWMFPLAGLLLTAIALGALKLLSALIS